VAKGTRGLTIRTAQPTPNMYYFKGAIGFDDSATSAELTLENFLPRGAKVKNSVVHALVVGTGVDTKIVMNQGAYSYKISNFEKQMNKIYVLQLI